MGKDKELNKRLNRIKKLQDRQKKSAQGAVSQANELDEILAVSRAEHEGVDPDRPPGAVDGTGRRCPSTAPGGR
ncbi:MAG: hypothetical protein AAFQ82_10550 [Myxococcota bacterium]